MSNSTAIVDLTDAPHQVIELEDGWYAVDLFGLINKEPLPSREAADLFLRVFFGAKKAD